MMNHGTHSGDTSGQLEFGSSNHFVDSKGRFHIKVKAFGFSGLEWITQLERNGFRICPSARHILRGAGFERHRLIADSEYAIALVRGEEIRNDSERTTAALRAIGEINCKGVTKAETACLLREVISDGWLTALGLSYIAVLHEPIADPEGDPAVLGLSRYLEGQWLKAHFGERDGQWDRCGAFGFAVPIGRHLA